MKIITITCNHKGHGGIAMMDHPKNENDFEYFLESFRQRGCDPIVKSFDDEKPEELEP